MASDDTTVRRRQGREVASSFGLLVKILTPLQAPSDITLLKRERGAAHYCWVRVEV